MSLLARIKMLEPTETWPRLQQAANERYWDGLALVTGFDTRRLGAVYLLGYVAEMLLKVAFFRRTALPDTADIAPALNKAKQHAAWHKKKNLHAVEAWADLLIAERANRGDPLDPALAGSLRFHAATIAGNWSESLRYKESDALESEFATVYESVEWLRRNCNIIR